MTRGEAYRINEYWKLTRDYRYRHTIGIGVDEDWIVKQGGGGRTSLELQEDMAKRKAFPWRYG